MLCEFFPQKKSEILRRFVRMLCQHINDEDKTKLLILCLEWIIFVSCFYPKLCFFTLKMKNNYFISELLYNNESKIGCFSFL